MMTWAQGTARLNTMSPAAMPMITVTMVVTITAMETMIELTVLKMIMTWLETEMEMINDVMTMTVGMGTTVILKVTACF